MSRRGFALPVAMMMGAVLFLVAGGLLHTVRSAGRGMAAGADAEGAYWLARAGLAQAREQLAADPDWTAAEVTVPFPDGPGRYSVSVLRRPVHFNDSWVVAATGTRNGSLRRLVAVLRTDSFSRYSFFTNRETTEGGDPIWFVGSDELHGPVFTNDRFHFYEDPHFAGTVGSVSPTWVHANATAREEVGEGQTPTLSPAPRLEQGFRGGQDPEETLLDDAGRDAAVDRLQALAARGGLALSGPQRLVLQGDTLTYAPIPGQGEAEGQALTVSMASLPDRVVYVDGEATLEGVLDGRLTVATRGDLKISGPLQYRYRSDRDAPQDDMLGVVSRRKVVILEGVPHNMHVDASILALGDSFEFQGNGFNGNPAVRKGRLTVYGGIGQVRRGVIGLFDGTGILAGFDKDYHYDARLSSQSPPWFPNVMMGGKPRIVIVSVRDMQSLGARP